MLNSTQEQKSWPRTLPVSLGSQAGVGKLMDHMITDYKAPAQERRGDALKLQAAEFRAETVGWEET